MSQKYKNNFIALLILAIIGVLLMFVAQAQTREDTREDSRKPAVPSGKSNLLKLTPFIELFRINESTNEFAQLLGGVKNPRSSRRDNDDAGTMLPLKPDFAYSVNNSVGNCNTYANSGNKDFGFSVEVNNRANNTERTSIEIKEFDENRKSQRQGSAELPANGTYTINVKGVSGNDSYTLWSLCVPGGVNVSLTLLDEKIKMMRVNEGENPDPLAISRLNNQNFNILFEIDQNAMNERKKQRYVDHIKPIIGDILENGFENEDGSRTPLGAIQREVVTNLDTVLEEKLGDCSYGCFSDSLNEAIKRSNFSSNAIANNFIKSGARNWVFEFEAINGRQSPIYGALPGSPLAEAKGAFWDFVTVSVPGGTLGDIALLSMGTKLKTALKNLHLPN